VGLISHKIVGNRGIDPITHFTTLAYVVAVKVVIFNISITIPLQNRSSA